MRGCYKGLPWLVGATVLLPAAAHAQSAAPATLSDAAVPAPGVQEQTPPSPPASQSGPVASDAIGDIIVTAQRRRENLQQVPITVTAVSASTLAAASITNTSDLVNVIPGLTVPKSAGYALPHLRGIGVTAIGPGIENSVATYIDGVYHGVSASNALALNNIAQVEVEKGPQGTLFGRNATGGLIQVTTKDPEPGFSGSINGGYANYNTFTGDAYLSGGTDTLAGDIAVQVTHQGDGWGHNIVTGDDINRVDLDLSVRSKWVFKPAVGTKITYIADYAKGQFSTSALRNYGTDRNAFYPKGFAGLGTFDVDLDSQPLRRLREAGTSLSIDQELGFGNLVSTTAYRNSRYSYNIDFDLGPSPYSTNIANQSDTQFTQELQLLSKSGSKISWAAGLYYYHASDAYDPQDVLFSGPAVNPLRPVTRVNNQTDQRTNSLAGYAQATAPITTDTKLTVGIRYTWERRDLDGVQTGYLNGVVPISLANVHTNMETKTPTWRVALSHEFSSNVNGYISYNRGLKSGGYNVSAPASQPYLPEKLDAYEIGLKTQLLGRRLTLNSSVFYYDYSNIQVSRFVNGSPQVYNGGKARVYGIDLDVTARVTDRFTITGGLEAMHSEFTSFPNADFFYSCPTPYPTVCSLSAKGNALPQAPNISGSINFDYRVDVADGEMRFNVNELVNGGFYFAPNNEDKQSAYGLTNASIAFTKGAYTIRFWGKNLLDKIYPLSVNQSPTSVAASYAAPRTFGITGGLKF